jgi:hypothetical protein
MNVRVKKNKISRARLALLGITLATVLFATVPRSGAASSVNDSAGRIVGTNGVLAQLPQASSPIASPGQQAGGVSPEGMRQIAALVTEKQSRTPAEQKIDSQLLQAVRESRGQQMAPGVDLEPAEVGANAAGRLMVDISAIVSDPLIVRIEALGGQIIYPSFRYNTIRARVDLSAVERIADFPEVHFIKPAERSMTSAGSVSGAGRTGSTFAERAANVREGMRSFLANRAAGAGFTGLVDSEGDRAHRADDTRNTYGYSGFGIKVGVLSDSFNSTGGAPADVLSGDLPGPGNPLGNLTPVTVVQDIAGGTDEGRAMLQIIHDLAPKAQLFFATADVSEAGFAENITNLQSVSHCDIIIDDVFYFDEPVFEDGIVAQAVDTVTAAGALYFSSAGNEGSLTKGTAGVFEGDFNDTGSPAFAFPGGSKMGTIHNFGTVGTPVNGDIITAVGEAYTLNWADAQGKASDDYDLFLVSSTGTVKRSSTNIQNGTQNPFEEIAPRTLAAGDRLVVFKTAASAKVGFSINTLRGLLTVATDGQTHGHSAASNIGVFSVAATPAAGAFEPGSPVGPFPNAFSPSDQVETFTSDGPRRVFFNSDGTAITPGNVTFAGNGGQVRNKPDITAADGVSTTLPSSSGLNPFYGTSAAAPHAGAIAALLKSAKPSLTQTQIRTILTTTALDVESAGYDNLSGFGIVQAFAAMQSVSPVPEGDVNLNSFTITEGELSNHNGVVEPGESANVIVDLIDPSLVTTSGVSATLSTTTTGITVVRNTASYGTLLSSSSASNTSSPFIIKIDPSVTCGTTIDFFLTATFGGTNSPEILEFTGLVGTPPINISAALGTPATGAGFTSTTGTQANRISRSGVASTCAAPKGPQTTVTVATPLTYDAYTFTNSGASSECVTVTMTGANTINVFTATYNNSGFVPASVTTNYLADPGESSDVVSYSFTAPAGQHFTVVVSDVSGTDVGLAYNLTVDLAICSATAATCPTITITPTSVPQAIAGVPYSQTFTISGGTPAYTLALTGTLPAGLSLNGFTISGTPTASGALSIKLTATDLIGCKSSATTVATTTVLNKCLRDDHTGDFILLNSTTGNYEFVQCGASEFTISGKGTVTTPNGIVTITDKESTRTVTISFNPGSLTGTATVTLIQAPGVSQTYRVSDTNPSAVCACGG